MKKVVALALSLFVLEGCATHGHQIDERQLAQMKTGESTWSDMTALLGEPTSVSQSSDGLKTASYSYMHAAARPETYIPIVGPLVGGADAKMQIIAFVFGADGKLLRYTTMSSQTGTGK